MDTAERRRASRLDAAGMPGSARAPSIPRRAPAEIFDFFGVGDQNAENFLRLRRAINFDTFAFTALSHDFIRHSLLDQLRPILPILV